MRKYEVIEDNGGGLTLVVFNNNDQVDYLHTGYEYASPGTLLDDLKSLENGDNPAIDWEGNEDNPQSVYDNITSFTYGWEIVADNNGMYPCKMGYAACREFGIHKE